MLDMLQKQRAAFAAELPVTAKVRKDRLRRAIDILLTHKNSLAAALSEDFGHRSKEQTLITDIMASVRPLKHAMKHVDEWMKPEKRKLDLPLRLFGAKAHIEYQPKGVCGVKIGRG